LPGLIQKDHFLEIFRAIGGAKKEGRHSDPSAEKPPRNVGKWRPFLLGFSFFLFVFGTLFDSLQKCLTGAEIFFRLA
jgi:hypothetical protein